MATFGLDIMDNFPVKMTVLKAMADLLRTTPMDRLSVKRICEAANVSHSTFYRNFKDKYAVAQWYLDYAYSQGVNKIGRIYSWQEGYYLTTAAIAEQSEFFRLAARSEDYNGVNNFASRQRRQALIDTIVDYKGQPLNDRLNFQIDVTIAMELWVFPKWYTGVYPFSLYEISRLIADTVPRELFELLNIPDEGIVPNPPESSRVDDEL